MSEVISDPAATSLSDVSVYSTFLVIHLGWSTPHNHERMHLHSCHNDLFHPAGEVLAACQRAGSSMNLRSRSRIRSSTYHTLRIPRWIPVYISQSSHHPCPFSHHTHPLLNDLDTTTSVQANPTRFFKHQHKLLQAPTLVNPRPNNTRFSDTLLPYRPPDTMRTSIGFTVLTLLASAGSSIGAPVPAQGSGTVVKANTHHHRRSDSRSQSMMITLGDDKPVSVLRSHLFVEPSLT